MEINTKYQVNDVVFLVHENRVVKGYVYRYKIECSTPWGMATHNFKPTDKLNIRVSYGICIDHYSKTEVNNYVDENKLFRTKKELLESL